MKFYHVIDNKHNKGLTIAVKVPGSTVLSTGEKFLITCGISYCAPMEQSFSRARGRLIAESRLSSEKEMPPFKRFSFFTDSRLGLKAQILSRLSKTLYAGWARSMVNREVERLSNNIKALEAVYSLTEK